MHKPLISIIVPLHNKGNYVENTLQSVLKQTYSNWELIIIENNSRDNSKSIVIPYVDNQKVYFYDASEIISGPGAARNYGLEQAKGEWILFLDADDLIGTQHLQNLTLHINEKYEVITGGWTEFFAAEKEIKKEPAGFENPNYMLKEFSILMAPWAIHSAIVKKALFSTSVRWQKDLDSTPSEDTAFWFRVLNHGTVKYVNSFEALYRKGLEDNRDQHDNLSLWLKATQKVLSSNLSFIEEQQIALSPYHCEAIMRIFSDLYEKSIQSGNSSVAHKALAESQAWLKKYFRLRGHRTLPLVIRRLLGIKNFTQLKQLIVSAK
jgi:glycosyltransferase involved in cell wall biosynthesis